jgi:tetrapyrrole methylase family protein/MazG family protein
MEGIIEETAELLEAIGSGDPAAWQEELGDLLFHLVIQAQIARERDEFTLTDVIAGIAAKLRRRHPHVWGDWQAPTSEAVIRNWEQLKLGEKQRKGVEAVVGGVPAGLPALVRAQTVQEKARSVGFDWESEQGVRAKIVEELAELAAEESPEGRGREIGDLLFAVVNLARWLGADAELALRAATRRFESRFRLMEEAAAAEGTGLRQLAPSALDRLWQDAKGKLSVEEETAASGSGPGRVTKGT